MEARIEGRMMGTASRKAAAFGMGILLVLAMAPYGHGQSPANKTAPHAGKTTSDPPLIDLAGYQPLLAKYHGKPLVVNFWATWCEPCRDEYRRMGALARRSKSTG